ncbi:MAG: hypothetical protein WBP46_02280 [Thiolinea sp.]
MLNFAEINALLTLLEDPNGYKREKATTQLGVLGIASALPKLLIRANDWVPQVRRAAVLAIYQLLTHNNVRVFIANLAHIDCLNTYSRADHRELITNIHGFIAKPENQQYLLGALQQGDIQTARAITKFCLKYQLLNSLDFVLTRLAHTDTLIRTLASERLRTLNLPDMEIALQRAINDPFMPVRREAFQMYLLHFPEKGADIAQQMLFDKHSSIQTIAIRHLAQQNYPVEDVFSQVLLSPNQSALKIRCALLGLSQLNARQQLPLIRGFSAHPLPSVRKAALQTVVRLSHDDEARKSLIVALSDKSPSVAKEASYLFKKSLSMPSLSELLDILESTNSEHTIKVCLFVFQTLNKWDQLIFILKLFARQDFAETANKALYVWNRQFNQSGLPATQRQIVEIAELYKLYNAVIETQKDTLNFTLRTSKVIT